jgi:hypothetical protein
VSAEFYALSRRIRFAPDLESLRRLERSATRVYNAGCLTPSEFGRLDVLIMERLALL